MGETSQAALEPRESPGGRFWLNAGGCLLVFAATFAAYFPALKGGFLWNDNDYVTKPELRPIGGLWRIWFEPGATEQYYPFLHTAFWVEHWLWGDRAVGYHLVNVALHATAACAFALVLCELWRNPVDSPASPRPGAPGVMAAWAAALLFALHPVCAESVAWISEEKNTLSAVFYLLAAAAYLRFDAERLRRWYGVGSVLFAIALLSKTVTATLPGALLVVLWWKWGRLSWRRDVVPLLPWFAAGSAAGLFSAWVERRLIGAEGADFSFSLAQRFLVAGRATWFYLGKLAWPVNLIFVYPRWNVDPTAPWQYAFPALAVALLLGLWLVRRRTRAPLATLLIFLGTLFPVLGFFNVYSFLFSFVADHFQYLACLPVIALASATAWRASRRGGFAAAAAAGTAAAILCVLGFLTWRQCGAYRDPETLYSSILEHNPACWMAHNNLAVMLAEERRPEEAETHYKEALSLRPGYAEAHNNYAILLAKLNRVPEAIGHLETALRLKPDYGEALNNLGVVETKAGRLPEATACLRKLERLEPSYPGVHYNLAIALTMGGRPQEALAEFEEDIRLKPDDAAGHYRLGNLFMRRGNPASAIVQYLETLRLKPGDLSARCNLGAALAMQHRLPESEAQYREAVHINPAWVPAHFGLGNVLAIEGNGGEAIKEYEETLRLQPDHQAARNNLERIQALLGSAGATKR